MGKFIRTIIILAILGGLGYGIYWFFFNGGLVSCFVGSQGMVEYEGLYYKPVEGGYSCWGAKEKLTSDTLVIPAEVEGKPVVRINGSAFKDEDTIKYITLPDTIKGIDNKAFDGCDNITSINSTAERTAVMPTGLESFGYNIGGMQNIFHLKFPGTNEIYLRGQLEQFVNIRTLEVETLNVPIAECFIQLSSSSTVDNYHHKVKVYDGYTHMMGQLRYDTYQMPDAFHTVTVRSGALPLSAFADTTLTTINIGNNVSSMGKLAFYQCKTITEINVNCPIANYAFEGCTSLTTVDFGANVTSIGKNAFKGCSDLIMFNNSMCKLPEGLISIGESAFEGCKIGAILLPESCATIGESAFKNCTNIYAVESYATSIGAHAFNNCTNLTYVDFNGKVESIGSNAFRSCTSLRKIYLPKSLTTISASSAGNAPFYMCNSGLNLYLEHDEAPDGFGSYWDNCDIDNLNKLTKHFDVLPSEYTED